MEDAWEIDRTDTESVTAVVEKICFDDCCQSAQNIFVHIDAQKTRVTFDASAAFILQMH